MILHWLNDRWVLIPSFGAGLFKKGDGLDLGSRLEFRSGIEIARRFHGEYRIGVALFHLSVTSDSGGVICLATAGGWRKW